VGAIQCVFGALGDNPHYRAYWLGNQANTLVMQMQQVANGYLAYTLTGSAAALGVVAFAQSAPMLACSPLGGVLAEKRRRILGKALNEQAVVLAGPLKKQVDDAAENWRSKGNIRRLWSKDASLWTGRGEGNWLGWLDVVDAQLRDIPRLNEFAAEVRAQEFRDVLLLGMGGSSLGPEVLAQSLGSAPGLPKLHVLESTYPQQLVAEVPAIPGCSTLSQGQRAACT